MNSGIDKENNQEALNPDTKTPKEDIFNTALMNEEEYIEPPRIKIEVSLEQKEVLYISKFLTKSALSDATKFNQASFLKAKSEIRDMFGSAIYATSYPESIKILIEVVAEIERKTYRDPIDLIEIATNKELVKWTNAIINTMEINTEYKNFAHVLKAYARRAVENFEKSIKK